MRRTGSRWWVPPDPAREPEQVFNACEPTVDLTPVSDESAEAVRAAWEPLLPDV